MDGQRGSVVGFYFELCRLCAQIQRTQVDVEGLVSSVQHYKVVGAIVDGERGGLSILEFHGGGLRTQVHGGDVEVEHLSGAGGVQGEQGGHPIVNGQCGGVVGFYFELCRLCAQVQRAQS